MMTPVTAVEDELCFLCIQVLLGSGETDCKATMCFVLDMQR